MEHSSTAQRWWLSIAAASAIVWLNASCDVSDPALGVEADQTSSDSDDDADNERGDWPSNDEAAVDCEVELSQCLANCSASLCGVSDGQGTAGGSYDDCVRSCYETYNSCSGGWKPDPCSQALEECLAECSPYFPRDPTSPWPDECLAACYAKQEQCQGEESRRCFSSVDCQLGYVCAWSAEDCSGAGGCEGAAGLCVPDWDSGSCEDSLTECVSSCEQDSSCSGTTADYEMTSDCVARCYETYDLCLGSQNGQCWSDSDCPGGSNCYFDAQECDPTTGECPGVCQAILGGIGDGPCDEALGDCLSSCDAAFDCPDGSSSNCDQSTPDNNPDTCRGSCWSDYDSCLYPEADSNDCELAYGDCLGDCSVVCDVNGCSPEPQCSQSCDANYLDCLDAR